MTAHIQTDHRGERTVRATADDCSDTHWVVTDVRGGVLDLCPTMEAWLNTRRRHVLGRDLYVFFARDREGLIQSGRRAAVTGPVATTAMLRPRERKPFAVDLEIVPESDSRVPDLRWRFQRFEREREPEKG
jgi:hypothetical protein